MKKIFTFILALVASAGTLFAESGTCGTNLTWDLTGGVLTISGTGAMTNWITILSPSPWDAYKSNIQSVVINDGVTTIGDAAFYNCPALSSVEIPYSVEVIGDVAFGSCPALTSVSIHNTVTSIGPQAFTSCVSLTAINVDDNNPNYCSVDGVLFNKDKTELMQCPGAKTGVYTIPNSVAVINDLAFSNCTGLTSIAISYSVTTIGDYAFANCSGLESLTCKATTPPACKANCFTDVPNNIPVYVPKTSLTDYNTDGWTYFTNIQENPYVDSGNCGDNLIWKLSYEGVLTISGTGEMDNWNSGEPSWTPYASSIKSVVVANGPTTIGQYAFKDYTNLKSVTIGNIVATIESYAFNGCTGLNSLTLGNGLTDIRNYAFMNCEALTSVTLPNSLTRIRDCAFRASGLTSIVIPNDVTNIGQQAFYNCSDLASLTIGNSVANIGNSAFKGCSGLTSITCRRITPPSCGNTCFDGVNKSIPLYVPNGTVTAYQNATIWEEFSNIQGADLPTAIDDINAATKSQKLLRDGQIFILRGDKTYTVTGQEVK